MHHEVELRLGELLKAKNLTQAELAKRVKIGEQVVAHYCKNTWTVLDRTILERMAGVLDCKPEELLATGRSAFFDSYGADCSCVFFKREDGGQTERGRRVDYRDIAAATHFSRLLEDAVPCFSPTFTAVTTEAQFDEFGKFNCVVLGSPMVNPASEIAICRAFNVPPFEPRSVEDLPFHFRVASDTAKKIKSSLVRPPGADGRLGICLRDEKEVLQMEAWPHDEFKAKEISRGRDCAIVLVVNHSAKDGPGVRKHIVLSGASGVGTEAAAMALADHFRDLEPRAFDNGVVWGALEVFYKKAARSTTREFVRYNWKQRRGGRCPVAFSSRV